MSFEIGLATFADLGASPSGEQRMQDLLEEAQLADQVGLDVFAVGEHHRPDYVVSSPAVALAAIAARTQQIRLSSAVTVLSSEDPVRVFQQFAELDLISGGRAEIMAGRGSFIESFPLFGNDLDDYDELYAEKLELLLKIREGNPVSWSGKHRAPLHEQSVYPRPVQQQLPIWVAVGGSPESVVRAAQLQLPLTLAIIGGQWEQFGPLVELYKRAWDEFGHGPQSHVNRRVAINTHSFIAPTRHEADQVFAAPYLQSMNKIGRERGWPAAGRREYDQLTSKRGAVMLGSPQEVTEKILAQHELFGNDRYMGQVSLGSVPHAEVLKSIELFGTEVAPVVKREIARREAPAGTDAGTTARAANAQGQTDKLPVETLA
jgi:probable LLM family oxidoreductase